MSDALFKNLPNAGDQKKGDEDLPEELKGKSPSEIFKTLQAAHIQEMAQTQQDYATKLEHLALVPPAAPVASPAQQQQMPQQPEPEPQFDLSNPDAYLDHQVNKKLAPLVQSVVASGRETGRQLAKQKYKDDFDKWGAEIEQFVDSTSPQMQLNPGVYDIARNFVRGQHVDEIIKERTESGLKEAVRSTLGELGFDVGEVDSRMAERQAAAQPAARPSLFANRQVSVSVPRSGAAANGGNGARGKLSQAEKLMCEKFNMSEEEYIQYKAENSDVLSTMGRE